jgi:membrane associated rhomboid family serine protease
MIPLQDDNPSRTTPIVTYLLIGACAVVFLWQASLGTEGAKQAVYALGLIPAVLFNQADLPDGIAVVPPVMTVLTSMFMHGGWTHLLGNMLYMWIFADNVEDSMGHVRFLVFYVLCGIAAAMAQALPDPSSQVPMVGASGAISGVLGAYLLLYPHARVLVIIPIGFAYATRLPAGIVLALWFGLQLLNELIAPPGAAGVAFRAHLGGFVAGLVLIPLFKHHDLPLLNRRRS